MVPLGELVADVLQEYEAEDDVAAQLVGSSPQRGFQSVELVS